MGITRRTAGLAGLAGLLALAGLAGAALWSGCDDDLPGAAPSLARELHLISAPEDGETIALLRFPLQSSFAHLIAPNGGLRAPDTYLREERDRNGAPRLRLDQDAYEDAYDGFVQRLLKDYSFAHAGQSISPAVGIVALVPLEQASVPPRGLIGAQSLLDICTEFPGREAVSELEVVIELYLPEIYGAAPVEITLSALPEADPGTEVLITDHRQAAPVRHRYDVSAPPVVTLGAGL